MNRLQEWFSGQPGHSFELFEVNKQGIIQTHLRTTRDGQTFTVLTRNPMLDDYIVECVEHGLEDDTWQGLVYLMHWMNGNEILPLYAGKAEKRGRSHEISNNLINLRKNRYHFARWGDGIDYHVGEVSNAIFGEPVMRKGKVRKPPMKYAKWVEQLFRTTKPPVLHRPVYLYLLNWHDGMIGPSNLEETVPTVEKQIIALASGFYPQYLMNIDGR